jgi:hypothetical protein
VYKKVNLLAELKRMAQGKRTIMPECYVAEWALDQCKDAGRRGRRDDSVIFLERLYALDDKRL